MVGLSKIVKQEVAKYAVPSFKDNGYAALDDVNKVYVAMTVSNPPGEYPARAIVMARVVGEYVAIDEDRTDKPLYEALEQAGIPRSKIFLLYAGETLPAAAPQPEQATASDG